MSVITYECVCEDDEFSHDCCDGDLWHFTSGDESVIRGFEIGVEPGGYEGGHVECLTDVGASSVDERPAGTFTGLSHDGGCAGQACGGLAIEVAEFGHVDQEGEGGAFCDARNGGQDSEPPGEFRIAFDQGADGGLDLCDLALDQGETLACLLPRLKDKGIVTYGDATAFSQKAKRILDGQKRSGWYDDSAGIEQIAQGG